MKKKLLLCAVTTLLCGGLGLLTLNLLGYDSGTLKTTVQTAIRNPEAIVQRSEANAFLTDDLLGWRVAPNIVYTHVGGKIGTTDASGRRVTPPSDGAPVLMLGCSFTWGASVEDQETFAWLCGEQRPDLRVINAGQPAYGPTQAYLILERELSTGKKFEKVVYCFFDHHVLRTTLNDRWQGYGNRWFPTLDEQLVAHIDRHSQRERRAFLQATDPAEHTLRIVQGMIELCRRHEQEFLVVRLPCPDYGQRSDVAFPIIWPQIEELTETLDLSDTEGGWYVYHPDAEMHRNLARRLAPQL